MKALILTIAVLSSFGVSASAEKASRTFLEFHAVAPVTVFGVEQAQALADAQFARIYGACGMTVLKGVKGRVWIFGTRVGYAGAPGADISIVEPPVVLPNFDPQNSAPKREQTPTSVQTRGSPW